MSDTACMVLTTFANAAVGQGIIDGLLAERLAACVQTLPVYSVYRWKGDICRDAETLALIKTTEARYPDVETFIRAHHDYECPEIVRVPIKGGYGDYLAWIGEQCR